MGEAILFLIHARYNAFINKTSQTLSTMPATYHTLKMIAIKLFIFPAIFQALPISQKMSSLGPDLRLCSGWGEMIQLLLFFKFLMWTIFKSLYWICYNIASLLWFFFFFFLTVKLVGSWLPSQGTEPTDPPTSPGRWSPKQWTVRKVPQLLYSADLSSLSALIYSIYSLNNCNSLFY